MVKINKCSQKVQTIGSLYITAFSKTFPYFCKFNNEN